MTGASLRLVGTWTVGIVAAAAIVPELAGSSKYFQFMIQTIMIFLLAATGLNIAIGLAGQFQMAQGAIMAVAAYTSAVLHGDLGWNVAAAMLGGFCLAMMVGLCVALFSARLSSHYLLLATFGAQVIVIGIIRELSGLTGGVNGRPALIAFELFGISFRGSTQAYSTLLLVVAGLGLLAAEWVKRSYLGLGMQAARQDERVVNASGLFANRFKFLAVAIGAAYAAMAGLLVGPVQTYLVPESFGIEITLLLLVIVILGGAGSTLGVALAAVVLTIASQLAQSATTAWPLIYGIFIMIMLTLTSRGLAGLGEIVAPLLPLIGRKTSPEPARQHSTGETTASLMNAAPAPTPCSATPFANGSTSASVAAPVLEAANIQKHFGGVAALDGISLATPGGTVVAVVGPNGSGKTTFFEVVSGFTRQSAGSIVAFGREIGGLGPVERARLGLGRSFQHPTILRECTVLENVLLGAMPVVPPLRRLLPVEHRTSQRAWEEAIAALELVGLSEEADIPAGRLSYGQRKLLDIARVVVAKPSLVLLDEPVAGVDAISANLVRGVVEHLRARGCTVLLVEHNMRFVMGLAERIVVLNSGNMIADGRPAEIAADQAVIRSYLGLQTEGPSPATVSLPATAASADQSRTSVSDGRRLAVEGLAAGYGGEPVVRGISLDVAPGKIVALIGANGAGKTTALKSIVGVVPRAAGRVLVDGESIASHDPVGLLSRGVAMVPEGRGVLSGLTVRENLLIGGYRAAQRRELDERLDDVYELFPRLRERSGISAGLLSGGEQQMLAIGRAMMTRPSFMLLDEPSMGLSPILVEFIAELLVKLAKADIGILLAEQNAQMALSIADFAHVLEQGSIALSGTGKALREDTKVREAYLGLEVVE